MRCVWYVATYAHESAHRGATGAALGAHRPRVHRKLTSIQHLEQKRSPFSGGQNLMSSELMSKDSGQSAVRLRHQIDELLALALDSVAGANAEAETFFVASEPQGATRWANESVRLLATTEQLMLLKRAMLQDQAILNAAARRSLAEDAEVSPDLRLFYRFVVKYLAAINRTLDATFAAIERRKHARDGDDNGNEVRFRDVFAFMRACSCVAFRFQHCLVEELSVLRTEGETTS